MFPAYYINPEKKGKIEGSVFHVFDLGTKVVVFDSDLMIPLMWGTNKYQVLLSMSNNLYKEMDVEKDHKVVIVLYTPSVNGFKAKPIVNTAIENIKTKVKF